MKHLVADIGATNARFCLAEGGALIDDPWIVPTASLDLDDAFSRYTFDAVGLAVAGPAADGVAKITNGTAQFDARAVSAQYGVPCAVVNDFHALAHGVPHFSRVHQIGGDAAHTKATKAVIGPGTGCGMSIMMAQGEGWVVLPSEGGHADLAIGSALEAELWTHLAQEHEHVSWETVLSGPGLQNLYRAMCGLWGMPPEPLDSVEIVRRGRSVEDPVCHQTLDSFFSILGSAAGGLAVTACALGGVYVAGGIVPTLTEFAEQSPLRRRFEERGVMQELAQKTPVFIVEEPQPGLLGAHHYLTLQLNSGNLS